MNDLTTLLKDADPARDAESLSRDDAQAIRREMMAAISEMVPFVPLWQRPLMFAAAAVVMVAVSGAIGHRSSSMTAIEPSGSAGLPIPDGGSSADRRQLQFATPGGTRIIWVFDPNLRLQESMP